MYIGEKDRSPLETIRLSTEYLQKRKVFFCEEWHANSSSLFSVSLSIPGTAFAVNGKGVNRELALASAHGELQERLLNNAFFRINSDTVYWMSDDNLESKADLNLLFAKIGLDGEASRKLIEECKDKITYNQKIEDDVFESANGEKLVIPSQITDYLYGTNGMCAGNTFEEACTQGLAEIVERYVAKQLFSKTVDVPNFDYEKLEKANYFRMLLKRLKKMGIDACVKDFSLGLQIPVVGVIFSNNQNHTFFLKMGAHPNLNIALERCFTEFAQGRTNKQLKEMVNCEEVLGEDHNRLLRYFVDGNTAFPISLMQGKGVSNLESFKSSSNKEYFNYMVECIESLGYEIYYKDNSSDVFKAYRIIVPGMSEIADASKMQSVFTPFDVNKNIKKFYDKSEKTTEMINEFADFIEKSKGLNKEIGLNYPILSVRMSGKRIPKLRMFELINLEYLRKGDISGSYEFLARHVDLCKCDVIYSCLVLMEKMIIEEKNDISDKDFFMDSLTLLFDKQICSTAYMILSKPNELFSIECDMEDNYFYKNRKELYRKLHE